MELSRLGNVIVVLGTLGFLRVVSESLRVYRVAMPLYFALGGLDLILALATVTVGVALRRGKAWSPRAVSSVAGFSMAESFGIGAMLAPETINALKASIGVENAIFVPRFAYYALAVVVWVRTVIVLLRAVPPEGRRSLQHLFLAAFVAGGLVGVIFFIQGR